MRLLKRRWICCCDIWRSKQEGSEPTRRQCGSQHVTFFGARISAKLEGHSQCASIAHSSRPTRLIPLGSARLIWSPDVRPSIRGTNTSETNNIKQELFSFRTTKRQRRLPTLSTEQSAETNSDYSHFAFALLGKAPANMSLYCALGDQTYPKCNFATWAKARTLHCGEAKITQKAPFSSPHYLRQPACASGRRGCFVRQSAYYPTQASHGGLPQ